MPASFLVDQDSREAISQIAKRYGVFEDTMANLAPVLFTIVAEHSLAKRRKSLSWIKEQTEKAALLIDQIYSVAPHLREPIEAAVDSIRKIASDEENSIDDRCIFGHLMQDGFEDFNQYEQTPFHRSLVEFAKCGLAEIVNYREVPTNGAEPLSLANSVLMNFGPSEDGVSVVVDGFADNPHSFVVAQSNWQGIRENHPCHVDNPEEAQARFNEAVAKERADTDAG